MPRTTAGTRTQLRSFGNAFSYNGTSTQGVLSNNPTTVTNNWSISAWVKPLSLPQVNGMIFYNGHDTAGWGLAIGNGSGSSGSALEGLAGNVAWIGGGPTLTNNAWQHVGLVRRNNVWYFYLNGVEYNSGNSTNPFGVQPGKASIGMEFNGSDVPSNFLNAVVDKVRVFNVALTGQQMFENYNMDVVPSGLVFEALGTNTNDTSSSGLTITYSNTSTVTSNTASNITRTTAGQRQVARSFGTQLKFTGGSNRVNATLASPPSGAAVRSVSCWFKPTSFSTQILWCSGITNSNTQMFELDISSSTTFLVAAWNSDFTFTVPAMIPNQWYYVVVTYDGANTRLYLNGTQSSTGAQAQNLNTTGSGFTLGIRVNNVDNPYTGLIDEVVLYNGYQLTQTDITNIYYTGIYPSASKQLWYKLDEGSGTSTTDSSGNNNTGTITGATYVTDPPFGINTRTVVS